MREGDTYRGTAALVVAFVVRAGAIEEERGRRGTKELVEKQASQNLELRPSSLCILVFSEPTGSARLVPALFNNRRQFVITGQSGCGAKADNNPLVCITAISYHNQKASVRIYYQYTAAEHRTREKREQRGRGD